MDEVSEFTESSAQACVSMIREFGPRIWNETHALDQVLETMLVAMQQTKSVESWYAARVYCHLALVNGSEAHRVCDAEFTRALLQIMRLNSAANSPVLLNLSTAAAGHQHRKSRKSFASDRMQVDGNEEDDNEDYDLEEEEEKITSKKKRARASMSPEIIQDWLMLFQTMVRLDGYLDELERIEVFIHLGAKLNSAECIMWFTKQQQHKDDEAVEYLLHALLQQTITTLNGNAMEASNSEWYFRALCALTNKQEYYLLAFCQRLALQCEVTTQAQRTRLIDFLQQCCGGGGGESKKRMEAFVCAETFHANTKATKRLLACDLLAVFTSGAKPCNRVLQVLCARTRDESAAVRCAAFRSLAQLAQTHNTLLVQNSHVLSSAIEAAQYDAKPICRRWAVKILSLVPEFNAQVVECCADRLKDVSPICRKAALDTLGLILHENKVNSKLVEALRTGVLLSCQDEDQAIRKQAVDMCRTLLCQCDDNDLHDYLFAIRTPVEIQCLKLALATGVNKDNAAALRDLQKRMIQCAIDTLPNEDSPVNRPMVWSSWLLLCITFDGSNSDALPSEKLLSSDFLFTAWQRVRDMLSLSETDPTALEETHALQQRVCRMLGLCAARLTLEQKNELGNTLLCDLSELTRAPVLCTEMLRTLIILSEFDCDNARDIINTWSLALKQCCEQYLLAVNKEPTKVDNALFLLGELALLGGSYATAQFTNTNEEEDDACVTLVQAFCSPDFVVAEQNANSRAFALVALGKLCLCDAVLAKRCMVLFVKQLGYNERRDNFVLRCNVLTILGDLGKKYTNLIEPFVDEQISTCLGDVNVQVRFRCLQMLANLLSEEYIKMRPRLFYRILACLADSNGAVSALAHDICTAFHTKESSLFFHLAGSGMVLAMNNESTLMVGSSTTSNNAVLVGVQRTVLNSFPARRLAVYTFMLSKLTEVQVLECGNKIRRDVWGALLDGTIGLECVNLNSPVLSNASRIVLDVFTLLEHITRVGGSGGGRKSAVDVDDENENDLLNTRNSSVQKATSKVLDSLERTNIANNVLPMLISLYQVSSKEKSSMVKPILEHFHFLYERFKPECTTALAPHRDIQALLKIKKPSTAVTATPSARRKRVSCVM